MLGISKIMDLIAILPNRKQSIEESRMSCIAACRAYKTDVCDNESFLKGENLISRDDAMIPQTMSKYGRSLYKVYQDSRK